MPGDSQIQIVAVLVVVEWFDDLVMKIIGLDHCCHLAYNHDHRRRWSQQRSNVGYVESSSLVFRTTLRPVDAHGLLIHCALCPIQTH